MKNKKLLILHGWDSNCQRWQKVKEILKKSGIEVLVPDLPGFGKNPPPQEAWGIEDYKKWVMKFAEDKGWQRFNLFGHSFGGGIAIKIAADPALFKKGGVDKLILCGCAAIRDEKIPKKVLFFYSLVNAGKKFFSLPVLNKIYPLSKKIFYRLYGPTDYYLAKGIMKDIFKKIISEDLKVNLEKIKSPTLILWGERDDLVPLSHTRILKEKIKNSKLVIFPGEKHALNLQIPEKLAKEVIKFLEN